MFYFLRENFEKAKLFFENVKDLKEIPSLISTCDSIISKKPSEIQILKKKLLTPSESSIPGLRLREDEIASKKLLELLYNDIFENTIGSETRIALSNELSCFYSLKMKILALNYIKDLKFKRDLKSYFLYRHDTTFIENLLIFSHQILQKNPDFNIKKEIRELCESVNTPHLWAFLLENCKEFSEENDEANLINLVERNILTLKKTPSHSKIIVDIMDRLEKKEKKKRLFDETIDFHNQIFSMEDQLDLQGKHMNHQESHQILENAKKKLIHGNFEKSSKLLKLVENPSKNKKIKSDIEYCDIIINLYKTDQTYENFEKLLLLSETEEPDFELKIEIFKYFVNKCLWEYMKRFFSTFTNDNFSKFACDFAQLNERDCKSKNSNNLATDIELFFKFLRYFRSDSSQKDYYEYIISTSNTIQLMKFSTLIAYTLFTLRMTNKMENESFINFRLLSSFYFAEDLLIAPSPNSSAWLEKTSEDILKTILQKTLEKIEKEVIPKHLMFIKEPKKSVIYHCLGDIYFEKGNFKKSIQMYLKGKEVIGEIESFPEHIIRKMIQGLLNLRELTCAACLEQFLTHYEQNIIGNIHCIDRVWVPYFYKLAYLEILMYYCKENRDILGKIIERPNLNPNSLVENNKLIQGIKKGFIKKMEAYFN